MHEDMAKLRATPPRGGVAPTPRKVARKAAATDAASLGCVAEVNYQLTKTAADEAARVRAQDIRTAKVAAAGGGGVPETPPRPHEPVAARFGVGGMVGVPSLTPFAVRAPQTPTSVGASEPPKSGRRRRGQPRDGHQTLQMTPSNKVLEHQLKGNTLPQFSRASPAPKADYLRRGRLGAPVPVPPLAAAAQTAPPPSLPATLQPPRAGGVGGAVLRGGGVGPVPRGGGVGPVARGGVGGRPPSGRPATTRVGTPNPNQVCPPPSFRLPHGGLQSD